MVGALINYITYVKREGNMVAHSLAHFPLSIFNYVVWMEDDSP